ncbi:M1 family metallopeptidase [Spirillospora sp. CA-294931]|uniref:M1 family metallopeptidase n=1 Tax=Spirillospora sp. CA-294931 TaxID=3240042 RepID=UPI003D8BAB09
MHKAAKSPKHRPGARRSVLSRSTAGLTALAAAGALAACQIDLRNDGGREDAPPTSPQGAGGAGSVGDPYVPGNGNSGYDVQHYKLKLAITPRGARELDGVAEITAKATDRLSRFNLDLSGLDVAEVKVDGAAAQQAREGSELIVSPSKPLEKGARFTVSVRYSGTPKTINDPILGEYGWVRTSDGVFVACQPSGAHTWFPSNDHPSDKATFDFEVTVPQGLTAIANGEPTTPVTGSGGVQPELPGEDPQEGPDEDPGGSPDVVPARDVTRSNARVTTTWQVKDPMATYLATVTVGRFAVRTGKTQSGVPVISAVDPSVPTVNIDAFHAKNIQVTDELTKMFGPYPFGSTGGLVDNAAVDFALETQTRPVYTSLGSDETIIAHELAHQWYGDSVSVGRWKDIWLNEGFATYAEWMWAERAGRGTVAQKFDSLYSQESNRELWEVPTGNPGRAQMFGRSVYDRGGMTLHALRKTVGDAKFFEILKTWAKEKRHSTATTPEFIATAERVSGRQLDAFFDGWLFQRGRPKL